MIVNIVVVGFDIFELLKENIIKIQNEWKEDFIKYATYYHVMGLDYDISIWRMCKCV